MANGVVNGSVGFTRKRLRDGSVAPLEEQERYAWEKAYRAQQQINARHNLEWMRTSGMKDYTDEEFSLVVSMLGLEDIDVENTAPSSRLSLGEPGSVEAGSREDTETDA